MAASETIKGITIIKVNMEEEVLDKFKIKSNRKNNAIVSKTSKINIIGFFIVLMLYNKIRRINKEE